MTTQIPTSRFVTHLDLGLPRHRMWLQLVLDRLQELDPDALQPGSESYSLWRGDADNTMQVGITPGPNPTLVVTPAPQPVATRQEWLTKIKALNLSQPDAQTCQSACIAMAVRDTNIGGIRRKLTALGSAGDPAVMRQVIRGYGVQYQFEGNACLQDVYGWLKAGEFLITHGWFTHSGHVICLDGLKVDGGATLLNVKDPWSEFNAGAWAYNLGGSFYDGFYSDRLIYAACVAGVGADDARRIYRAETADPLRRGMWVHRFLV